MRKAITLASASIVNRGEYPSLCDRLHDVIVGVTNVEPSTSIPGQLLDVMQCGYIPGPVPCGPTVETVTCPTGGVKGSYLVIQIDNQVDSPLTLCEVTITLFGIFKRYF